MMYHLFHNSIWKVVRIAKTSDCKISWRVFLQGTVVLADLQTAFDTKKEEQSSYSKTYLSVHFGKASTTYVPFHMSCSLLVLFFHKC